MKKYLILMVALLFATITVTTAQRKVATDKLQVTSLKSVEVLKTDEQGNVVAGELPEVDLAPIQTELNKKLDTGTYTGTASDLVDDISNAGKVKTVNGVAPDETGNVQVETGGGTVDLSGYVPYVGATRSLVMQGHEIKSYIDDYLFSIQPKKLILQKGTNTQILAFPHIMLIQDITNKNKVKLRNSSVEVHKEGTSNTILNSDNLTFTKKQGNGDKSVSLKFEGSEETGSTKTLKIPFKDGVLATKDDIPEVDLSGYVPYEGATKDIKLVRKDIELSSDVFSLNAEISYTGIEARSSDRRTALRNNYMEFHSYEDGSTIKLYKQSEPENTNKQYGLYVPAKNGTLATKDDIQTYTAGDGIAIENNVIRSLSSGTETVKYEYDSSKPPHKPRDMKDVVGEDLNNKFIVIELVNSVWSQEINLEGCKDFSALFYTNTGDNIQYGLDLRYGSSFVSLKDNAKLYRVTLLTMPNSNEKKLFLNELN